MRTVRRVPASLIVGLCGAVVLPPALAQEDPAPSAKTWIDRAEEREEHPTWAESGSAQDAGQPRQEPQASIDESSAAGGDQLLGRLLSTLDETLVLMPRSELSWLGTVVRLSDHEGVDAAVARAGVDKGYTFGLITDIVGLMCLSPNRDDPVPYDDLGDLVGHRAEVFGFIEEADGMRVACVSACRRRAGPPLGRRTNSPW